MVYLKSVENVITLGKLIGLLFLFCLPLLSILFLKTKMNDLARPVMGTIFLVVCTRHLYVRPHKHNVTLGNKLRNKTSTQVLNCGVKSIFLLAQNVIGNISIIRYVCDLLLLHFRWVYIIRDSRIIIVQSPMDTTFQYHEDTTWINY